MSELATKEKTVLAEKVDTLIKESERARRERKRDRILSKMDGLYYVLISLTTFASGLMISQHGSLSVTSLYPLTGFLLSMLASFAIGFKGMISDSMENRILAWCLLIASITWVSVTTIPWWAGFALKVSGIWLAVASFAVGCAAGFFTIVISMIFTRWIEARLSSLLGENVEVWSKIVKRIDRYVFALYSVSIVLTIAMSLVL